MLLRPKLRPIRIKGGASGHDTPESDLMVSPQHRVLIRSRIARKMFGSREILVAARQLLHFDGIDIARDLVEVDYFHILFDRHEIILSNGAETESLFTGPVALKTFDDEALNEIFAIFPGVAEPGYLETPARPLPRGNKIRRMALRHQKNNLLLVSKA